MGIEATGSIFLYFMLAPSKKVDISFHEFLSIAIFRDRADYAAIKAIHRMPLTINFGLFFQKMVLKLFSLYFQRLYAFYLMSPVLFSKYKKPRLTRKQ